MGAEEEGEIILCGIHYSGQGTKGGPQRSRNTSADTESDTDGSRAASATATPNTQCTLDSLMQLPLLPIAESLSPPSMFAVDGVSTAVAASLSAFPPCHPEGPVPLFETGFDTSALECAQSTTTFLSSSLSYTPTPTLHASATQCAADSSRDSQGQGAAIHPMSSVSASSSAFVHLSSSRRATLPCSGSEPAPAVAAAHGSVRTRSRRGSAPYDFSQAGHLIIDGFEISKKGVTRTPETSCRRLGGAGGSGPGGSTSCGGSPMLMGRALRGSSFGSAGVGCGPHFAAPPAAQADSTPSANVLPYNDSVLLPHKLFATTSEPTSLTNTPTLLGRRLSIVKLQQMHQQQKQQQQRELDAAASQASSDADSLSSFRHSLSGLLLSASSHESPLTDSELKSTFGSKFKLPKAASLGIEMRLSDLVRLGEVGRGVNGAVHKAVHLPTLRIVALKSVSIFDQAERHQFLQELHAFLNCRSGQMVGFIGACFSEGHITMALEYLNRGSLDHVIRDSGPLDETTLRIVLQQLLMGVRDLHAQNYLHRDIKPANFLINNDGVAKVSDFGLLKQLVPDEQGRLECSKFAGTMLYLSPERIAGGSFSFPSDIYSVGLSALFLATGSLQQPTDFWALVALSASEAPQPSLPPNSPDGLGPHFSDQLRDIVDKMLAKDPAARWTAQQLLEHPWFTEAEGEEPEDGAGQQHPAMSPSKMVDPLENWPGRQLLEPQADELALLMDAVIHRWYPMPTAQDKEAQGQAKANTPFQPSSFDLARFTHLAQQLGWKEAPVVDAFTERIRQKMGEALEAIAASTTASAAVSDSSTQPACAATSSNYDSPNTSLTEVSARSSVCFDYTSRSRSVSMFSSTSPATSISTSSFFSSCSSSSSVSSASPASFVPNFLISLPSFGSPRHMGSSPRHSASARASGSKGHSPAFGCNSNSNGHGVPSPLALCLSPSSKPPKAPLRSYSPTSSDLIPSLLLGPTATIAGGTAISPESAPSSITPHRMNCRRLNTRRESFHMRLAEAAESAAMDAAAAAAAASTPFSPHHPSPPTPRSFGLGLGGADGMLTASIVPPSVSSRSLFASAAGPLSPSASFSRRSSSILQSLEERKEEPDVGPELH